MGMDSFSLDSIRDVFEADITRNLGVARAGIQRCLKTLTVSGSWLAVAATAPDREGMSPQDAQAWRTLIDLVHRAEAMDAFERQLVSHTDAACTTIESLLRLELAGERSAALTAGAAQVTATEGVLGTLRQVLRTGDLPMVIGEVDGDVEPAEAELVLATLLQRAKHGRSDANDLEEVEHCYHAIRGSSGMVALQSMAECARVLETLTVCTRQLDGLRTELLAQIAMACQALLPETGSLIGSAEADDHATAPAADDAEAFSFAEEPQPAADGEAAPQTDAAAASQASEFDLFDEPAAPTAPTAAVPAAAPEPTPEVDAFSSLDFAEPSERAVDPTSRISALETALNFGGDELPTVAQPPQPEPADFGEDLFDSPSLAVEPGAEAEPAPAARAADNDPASVLQFDFEAESVAPAAPQPATPELDGVDQELVEIFLEEARQCLGDLRRSFTRVAADCNEVVAWLDLSRHFHLLKGSAGTVGIHTVSKAAGELEDRAERFGERRSRATPADVAKLRADARAMLAGCGIELEDEPRQGDTPSVVADELRQVFQDEAKDILAEVTALAGDNPERRPGDQDRATLAALLHRLKGSAVLHGSEAVGKIAAELHDLCDDGEWPTHGMATLLAGIARLRDKLGIALPSVVATRVDTQASADGGLVDVTVEAEAAVWEAFQMEVAEAIEQLDRLALELETTDQPRRRIEDAFRTMHTLKGACNTVGLAPTGAMLHIVEDYLEGLQKASVLPPLSGIVRVLLEALDGVRRNLKQATSGKVSDWLPRVQRRIESLQKGGRPAGAEVVEHASVAPSAASGNRSEQTGAGSGSASSEGASRGVLRVSAERLDRLMDLIGELVVHRSQLRTSVGSFNRLQNALKKNRSRLFQTIDRFREQYEFHGLAGQKRQRRDTTEPQPVAKPTAKPTGKDVGKEGRRDLGFSDLELDHYDEVNILARSLEEIDSDITQIQNQIDAEIELFNAGADGFGALISSLQGEITEARMVPVDQLFLRLRRPVRDAADRLGKEVRVTTSGEDVTLDKAIIDQLFGPLLHLVRNSVSHGIEGQQDRAAAGKHATGTVRLAARQEAGQIVIEVSDDGRGLDLQSLRRIGVERGLLPADVSADDPRVKELIFVSGLSTKKQADAVSGRGVGCDVVRRAIEHLSGVIDVITEAGRGTTFRITMPLTLAIYRALIVRHAGLTFALPIAFAERILDSSEVRYHESSGVRRLMLDDQFLEVRDLAQMMGLGDGRRASRNCVVLRLGPDRIAIGIDEIVGQDEIVVKSLGDLLSGHQMFSGVTVDGEGNLILILEVSGMFHGATRSGSRLKQADVGHVTGEAGEHKEAATSRRVRILYADDSLSVRKAAEKFLGEVGVDVVLAVDGVDALEKLRGSQFDMVFTDLEMPRMHGFDLLREMRYIPAFKDLPVVVVTSRSGDKHRQQAEKLGCNGYLGKPFSVPTLREQILRHVDANAGAGGLTIQRAEAAR